MNLLKNYFKKAILRLKLVNRKISKSMPSLKSETDVPSSSYINTLFICVCTVSMK